MKMKNVLVVFVVFIVFLPILASAEAFVTWTGESRRTLMERIAMRGIECEYTDGGSLFTKAKYYWVKFDMLNECPEEYRI